MHLYNITLQKPSIINAAVLGNFSGKKQQELAVARGQVLEILRVDSETGKLSTIHSVEAFGCIRDLVAFKLTGGTKDFLVASSDSGRLVVLEYDPTKNCFVKVHQESYGRTGCRRIVPGQYLASDPKGRAIMVAAIEKQKLVYVMNRDSQARLTISSPLEAHKPNTFLFHAVGMDVGFENPVFACLEVDYEEADADHSGEVAANTRQLLAFYELDLGLNHVVRKVSEPLEERANRLVPVPGGSDGPSGVLVCSENYITYKNMSEQIDVRAQLPRRKFDLDDPDRSVLIVATAVHKTKSLFFFLMQTDQGDLFKVTLETDEDVVTEIKIKYLDTIPVARSLCVLRTGFLFVAAEFGNHYLYQIAYLGENDSEIEFSSSMPADEEGFVYETRSLKNLVQVDEWESLCPLVNCNIADVFNEDTPQFFALCGRGARSTLRILRHGLEVTEMAKSELPGSPNAVWTVKRHIDDQQDAYIIVSFVNATLVLSIGETVEEVADSGFLGTTPTIGCGLLGDDSLLQVYAEGIRHIRADKRVNEWKAPGRRLIERSALNERQVAVALSGATPELVYFEMDQAGGLNEYTDRREMTAQVLCMALGRVPIGEQRSRFLAVGLSDQTVRIFSLDPHDCLQPLSLQALPAMPESLALLEIGLDSSSNPTAAVTQPGQSLQQQQLSRTTFLTIGLANGVLLRSVIDRVSGDLSDTRTRYLGARPVKLFPITVQNNGALLALSSRSWLSYYYHNRYMVTPLSYDALEYASGFRSEQCAEGVVAIAGNTLRIMALEKLGSVFNQISYPIGYTPRRFAIHPLTGTACLIETDHNAHTQHGRSQRRMAIARELLDSATATNTEAAEMEEGDLAVAKRLEAEQKQSEATTLLKDELPVEQYGLAKAGFGKWASRVRLLDPSDGRTLFIDELDSGDAAVSLALVRFASDVVGGQVPYLLVGTAKNLQLQPRVARGGGSIRSYQFVADPETGLTKLRLLHVTPVDEVPYAICPVLGRVCISIGKVLRVYDLGKKKLLRKCESRLMSNMIVDIRAMGPRIFVSDVQDSCVFGKYKLNENRLCLFADDTLPRWVTTSCVLDYNSVAVADKFGNLSVLRVAIGINDEVQDDDGSFWQQERGYLNGAGLKSDAITSFHIGEQVTMLQKCTLIPGGNECLVYATLSGRIGAMLPFTSREDREFFQHLELHMRTEMPPLSGRDHISYRSSFAPVRNVIDGDMCEQYNAMSWDKQKEIAEELDRTPSEVSKKLEDIRNRYAF